jgi:DNA-binding transcriptional LysR family regulator
MDKLASLQIFRRVAEARSFTAAAQALGVSPAMISKSIQQLEQQLGARLLVRSTRAVSVTEAGERYLQLVAPLLDELLLADQQLQQSVLQPRGELRISAPVDLGEQLLPPVIQRFRSDCPAVTVAVDLSSRQVDLHHEPIDVALRVGQIAQASLIVRQLTQLPLVVCAAPAYLEANPEITHPRDLAAHNCLVNPSVGDPLRWRFQQRGKLFSIAANVVLQINNTRLLVRAAEAGLGVIYLPVYLVKEAIAKQRLRPLLSDYVLPALPVSIAYVERRLQLAKVRTFIDYLAAELQGDTVFAGAVEL